MGYKLAIDFGMTNSVIAQWDESIADGRTLDIPFISAPTSAGVFLIPTLLYVRDGRTGDVVIGQAVLEQGLDHQTDNRLFRNFKRTLKAEASFDSRLIDGVPWTEAQAGQIFLRRLLKSLPYQPNEIEQLVITVPVAALDEYTAWLGNTVNEIPVEKIRIVDESTAAALGHTITEPGATVLIIDFGGGTLDLSLVRLPTARTKTGRQLLAVPKNANERAQVIAKAGIALGGSDIDQWLLQEVLRREHLLPETLGTSYAPLLSACEQAKIVLSKSQETTVQFTGNTGHETVISFTRDDLEALLRQNGLFTALTQVLEKVMGLAAQKGVYREDIQHVLLVGGTSLIPSVQQTLDEYFRNITKRQRKAIAQMPTWPATSWNIENTSIRVDKPFTAVVEGALLVSKGFQLDDQLAHGYGLRYLDETGKYRFDEIIAMRSTYPSKKPVSVTLGASQPHQAVVEFVIGQINMDALAATEVQIEGGQKISITQAGTKTQQIVPINAGHPLQVRLSPPGQPGKARLHAEFKVDAMRRLLVSVSDLKTRNKLLVDMIVATLGTSPTMSSTNQDNTEMQSGAAPALLQQRKSRLQLIAQRFMNIFDYFSPEKISVDAFLAALQSEDALARFDAADALARRGDREARLAFENILQTGTAHQRASAARHLHHFSWFTAESLFRQTLNDDDMRVREAAAFALCKMRTPEAYVLASDILTNSNDAIRLSAVWALYNHPDPAAVPVLAVILRAENPEVRELALEVLGATETPQAIPIVKSLIDDPSTKVRYAATLSWVELAREACFSELADWINRTQGESRYWILRGFFHATNYMGIESGTSPDADVLIQALENALHDELPRTRLAAFLPLAWMRHPAAEKALATGFRNEPDSDTKAHMLVAAKHLMSPVAGILLEDAQQSNDPLVRQTAEFLTKRQQNL